MDITSRHGFLYRAGLLALMLLLAACSPTMRGETQPEQGSQEETMNLARNTTNPLPAAPPPMDAAAPVRYETASFGLG
jgi:hypothetical protein